MGTYTTNYQLYMPTVGETGWGTLVNTNFTTIDTTMKGLSNRITAVENEVNGNLSCTSVTTSGTITSTGLITANGGVKGNLTGNITGNVTGNCFGRLYVNATIATSGEVQYATCAAQSKTGSFVAPNANTTQSVTCFTITGYSVKSISYPVKMGAGAYVYSSSYVSGSVPTSINKTVTFSLTNTSSSDNGTYACYGSIGAYNSSGTELRSNSIASIYGAGTKSTSITANKGEIIKISIFQGKYNTCSYTVNTPALSTYYLQAK